MNKKPHKHAELIKAWADGAEIEMVADEGNWVALARPVWDGEVGEYRIKPDSEPAAPAAPAQPHPYDEILRALDDGVPATEFEYLFVYQGQKPISNWLQLENEEQLFSAIKNRREIRRKQKSAIYTEVFRALADGVPLTECEYCWPFKYSKPE